MKKKNVFGLIAQWFLAKSNPSGPSWWTPSSPSAPASPPSSPSTPSPPSSPFAPPPTKRWSPQHLRAQADPEETAKICANFITHLFACPDLHPHAPSPTLATFITYALRRTRLHSSVTFAALYLLRRLKARFPAARGSSGHRLFLSAFMLAAKMISDVTYSYSNNNWLIVGQGMFSVPDINQMEREMCSQLEWQLNIDPKALRDFEKKIRRKFKGPGPYLYTVSPAPSSMASTSKQPTTDSVQSPVEPSMLYRDIKDPTPTSCLTYSLLYHELIGSAPPVLTHGPSNSRSSMPMIPDTLSSMSNSTSPTARSNGYDSSRCVSPSRPRATDKPAGYALPIVW